MNSSTLAYLQNGQSLAIDPERCTACAVCLEVCPHNVLAIEARQAVIKRRELCMECGACQNNCPAKAISVKTGVGCVAAIVNGLLKGTAPSCDCGGDSGGKCC